MLIGLFIARVKFSRFQIQVGTSKLFLDSQERQDSGADIHPARTHGLRLFYHLLDFVTRDAQEKAGVEIRKASMAGSSSFLKLFDSYSKIRLKFLYRHSTLHKYDRPEKRNWTSCL